MEDKRQIKREQFKADAVSKTGKKPYVWVIILIILATSIAIGAVKLINREDPEAISEEISSEETSTEETSGKIEMTDITVPVNGGKLEIPFSELEESKFVRFEYERENSGGTVPVLAFIKNDGQVVTAISECEPCKSTRFFIEGNEIVCKACFSRWDLNTFEGVSGGCLEYPPFIINNSVEGDKILIDEAIVNSWTPRI